MENKTVEELVKENKDNMVTTTQLRQLLSNAVRVKNNISLEKLKKDQQLTPELLNRVKYLLIKHLIIYLFSLISLKIFYFLLLLNLTVIILIVLY